MNASTAEQKIADMRRVTEFMNDEVIVRCLANMKWKCYDEFVKAEGNEQRLKAQARAHNLEEFANELQVVRDRGEVEMLTALDAAHRKRL